MFGLPLVALRRGKPEWQQDGSRGKREAGMVDVFECLPTSVLVVTSASGSIFFAVKKEFACLEGDLVWKVVPFP